jgi:hypothetical protein
MLNDQEWDENTILNVIAADRDDLPEQLGTI